MRMDNARGRTQAKERRDAIIPQTTETSTEDRDNEWRNVAFNMLLENVVIVENTKKDFNAIEEENHGRSLWANLAKNEAKVDDTPKQVDVENTYSNSSSDSIPCASTMENPMDSIRTNMKETPDIHSMPSSRYVGDISDKNLQINQEDPMHSSSQNNIQN